MCVDTRSERKAGEGPQGEQQVCPEWAEWAQTGPERTEVCGAGVSVVAQSEAVRYFGVV